MARRSSRSRDTGTASPPATVAAVSLVGLTVAASSLGFDAEEVLQVAGVQAEDLIDRDRQLPVDVLLRVWDLILSRRTEEDLGLQVAQAMADLPFGLLDCLLQHSPTLGAAFEKSCRYQALIDPGFTVRLRRVGDRLWATVHHTHERARRTRQIIEELVALTYLYPSRLAAQPVTALEVRLQTPAPAAPAAYEAFFGCPVRFGHPENLLVYPQEVFDLPIPRADPLMAAYLERLAAQNLETPPVAPGEGDRIRQAIEAAVLAGDVTQERVARELGLSLRTLQRRLEEVGQTYSGLLQEVRLALARRHLRDPAYALIDVAFVLGYAEVTSFHRAFKRWTGQTPEQFRLLAELERSARRA